MLIVFTGIALALLDRTFRQTAESSLQDNLQAQMYALLTVVEPAADGALDFIETLAEPRFSVADSGLYAFIYDEQEFRSWNSASALSIEPPETVNVATGDRHFGRETNTEGDSFYVMRFGVAWDLGDGVKPAYTFVISESSARFDSQISKFRENLFLWSSIATFTLLALQLLMLRWALDPLQRVAREISRVEQGVQSQITGEYPQEISTLTNSLNGLILSSRRALERYRNSLGDLAHSLKTPLAVLRGASPNIGPESEFELTVDEQVDRMQLIVDFQLRRAGNSGGAILIKPLLVKPAVDKLLNALQKVYFDRAIVADSDLNPDLLVAVDEGDLMEILGNVLENAFKWCDSRVKLSARKAGRQVELIIADDGPGIPDAKVQKIFGRGVRADEQVPGQGIGLAVAHEIVQSYAGKLSVQQADLGGAEFQISLPGA